MILTILTISHRWLPSHLCQHSWRSQLQVRKLPGHRSSLIVTNCHQSSSLVINRTICPPLHSCQQQLLGWLRSRCSVLIQSLEWRSVAPSFNVCHHPLNTTMYCSIASMHWITPYWNTEVLKCRADKRVSQFGEAPGCSMTPLTFPTRSCLSHTHPIHSALPCTFTSI